MSRHSIYFRCSCMLFSMNYKDIGSLSLIFGVLAGAIETTIYLIIRFELATPRNQVFNGNSHFYNAATTVHASLIIFFLE